MPDDKDPIEPTPSPPDGDTSRPRPDDDVPALTGVDVAHIEDPVAPPLEETPASAIERLIESEAPPAEIFEALVDLEPVDVAETLERLEPEQTAEVMQLMEDKAAADALVHMEGPLAATILLDLEPPEQARLFQQMEPDDAADLLQALPRETRGAVLELMPPRSAAHLGKLVLYDPHTAGGIMTTDIAVVRAAITVGQALDLIRRHPPGEAQTAVFCVDDRQRLVGTISLRDLIIADSLHIVADHMESDFDSVAPDMDREKVADLFARYDLLTVPVIDDHERLLGMITIDDVVDILQAEATEDALKQVGVSEAEAVFASVPQKLRGRAPWLLANLLLSQLGAVTLLIYHDLISLIPVVALFFPIIANQSGNSGNQSMAVTLRGIVLGQVKRERLGGLIRKELAFGLTCGLLIGVIFGLGAAIVGPLASREPISGLWLGIVAGVAMATALGVSCLIGVAVPVLLRRFGQDPATASSIFVTMLTDAISYATFLTLAFVMRGALVVA